MGYRKDMSNETYSTDTDTGLSEKEATKALRRNAQVRRESDGAVCRLAGARRAKSPYAVNRWVGGKLVALTPEQVARVAATQETIERNLERAATETPMTASEDRGLAADAGWVPEWTR